MNYSTLLLAKFQTENLEAYIKIILTIEWQQHSSIYVRESEGKLKAKRLLRIITSTKGVVSVIKTSCAHSVTLKRISKTPHSFMHFHIVIWTRELLWKYRSCLSKLLSQELWPKQLRERLIIVAKMYIFLLKKKQDNSLRRSYISIQIVIQCHTMCILDV